MNLFDQYRFQVDRRRREGRAGWFDLLFTYVRNAWINWRRGRLA